MLHNVSLTKRLALMVSALVAVSIFAVLGFAYYEIRVAGDLAESARIQQSVTRVAATFEGSGDQRNEALKRLAANPAIQAAVATGRSSKVVDSILSARRGADTAMAVFLLDARGRVVAGQGPVAEFGRDVPLELALRASPDSGYISPLLTRDGEPRTLAAFPVHDGPQR